MKLQVSISYLTCSTAAGLLSDDRPGKALYNHVISSSHAAPRGVLAPQLQPHFPSL